MKSKGHFIFGITIVLKQINSSIQIFEGLDLQPNTVFIRLEFETIYHHLRHSD